MSENTMQLVLIRHGQSEWNKLNLFTGWTDVDLTDEGRAEAAAGGRALAEEGFDFDVCYPPGSSAPSTRSTSCWGRWTASGCPS